MDNEINTIATAPLLGPTVGQWWIGPRRYWLAGEAAYNTVKQRWIRRNVVLRSQKQHSKVSGFPDSAIKVLHQEKGAYTR